MVRPVNVSAMALRRGCSICGAGALLGTYDLIQTKHTLASELSLASTSSLYWLKKFDLNSCNTLSNETQRVDRTIEITEASSINDQRDALDEKPFGTQLDVYTEEYEWLFAFDYTKTKVHCAISCRCWWK